MLNFERKPRLSILLNWLCENVYLLWSQLLNKLVHAAMLQYSYMVIQDFFKVMLKKIHSANEINEL